MDNSDNSQSNANFSSAVNNATSPRERSQANTALADSLRRIQVGVEPTLQDNIARPTDSTNKNKYQNYETAKRQGGVEAVREAVKNTRLSETVPIGGGGDNNTSHTTTSSTTTGRSRMSIVGSNPAAGLGSDFGPGGTGGGGTAILPDDLMMDTETKPPSWRMATSEAHQDYQAAKRESASVVTGGSSMVIDPRDTSRRGSLHHKRSSASDATGGSGSRSRSPKPDPSSTYVTVGVGMDVSALQDESYSSSHHMRHDNSSHMHMQDNSNQRREAEYSKLEPNGMDVSAVSRSRHSSRRGGRDTGSVHTSDAQLKAGLRNRSGPSTTPGVVSVSHHNRNSSPVAGGPPRSSSGSGARYYSSDDDCASDAAPPTRLSQAESDARIKAGLRNHNLRGSNTKAIVGAMSVTSSAVPQPHHHQQQEHQHHDSSNRNAIRNQLEADAATKAMMRRGSQRVQQQPVVSSIPHSVLKGGPGGNPSSSGVSVFTSGTSPSMATNSTGTTMTTTSTTGSKNPAVNQAEADLRLKAGLRKSNHHRYSTSHQAASDDQDKMLKAGLRRQRLSAGGGCPTVPGAVPMTNLQTSTTSTTASGTIDSDAQIKAGLRNNRNSMISRRSSHHSHHSRVSATSTGTGTGLPMTHAELNKFQRQYQNDSGQSSADEGGGNDDDYDDYGNANDSPYDDEPMTAPSHHTTSSSATRPGSTYYHHPSTNRGLRNSISGNSEIDPAVRKFGMRRASASSHPPGGAAASGTSLGVAGVTPPVAGASAVVDLEQGTNSREQGNYNSRRVSAGDGGRYEDDGDIRVQGENEIDYDISVRPIGSSQRGTRTNSRIPPPPSPTSGRYHPTTNMAHTDTAYMELQREAAAAAAARTSSHNHGIPQVHHDKDENDKKKSKTICCIVLFVLAAIIAVVVGVVVTSKSSDNDGGGDPTIPSNDGTESGTTTTTAQEGSGSGDMVPISQVFPTIDLPEATKKAIESQRAALAQVKAYKWLVEDPQGLDYSEAQRLQRFVLATFYHSTDGDHWIDTENKWLDYNTHECSWYSTAQKDTIARINVCDGYDPTSSSRFDHHDYTALHLSGQFDREIQDRVKGSLPPELGLLTNLRYLNCGFQKLRRNIPSELGLLSNSLNRVVLYQNSLTGTIPTSLFTFVGSLWLSRNPFNNPTIPTEVGLNSRLESILLLDAGVVGTLPKELFQTGSYFNTFLMELNRLTGTIPTEIGLATHLRDVQLSKSRYSGEIPTELGRLNQLTSLDIAGNRLVGTICSELGNLAGLQTLNVMGNKLEGELPTELVKLKQLRELKLSNTLSKSRGLTGQIPSEYFTTTSSTEDEESSNTTTVATFPHLTHLWIEDTNLDATIPTEIALMSNLRSIRMGLNRQTPSWTLPTELGLLSLTELTLAESKLYSTIPSEFGRWQHMQNFDVANNELTGTLPTQIGTWRRPPLEWFGVYGNPGLVGSIPDHFCGIHPSKFGCAAEEDAGNKANNLCGCNCGPCSN